MTTDNQKYEITNQAHPHYPWLHRIRALKDVREGVKAGTLGGYVQSADNLSQDGAAWIADTCGRGCLLDRGSNCQRQCAGQR